MIRPAAVALLLLLGGCTAAGNVIGVIAGAAAGGATANPAVGFGVGVGVAAASDYALRSVSRRWHRTEQDAIADAAGGLADGGAGPWRVRHSLPFGNAHGEVRMVREIPNPLAPCRQVLFSVADDDRAAWYSVNVCRGAGGWKWASAEPAVERWGVLQ